MFGMLLLPTIAGCGLGGDDQIRRAAMRRRAPDDETEQPPVPTSTEVAKQDASAQQASGGDKPASVAAVSAPMSQAAAAENSQTTNPTNNNDLESFDASQLTADDTQSTTTDKSAELPPLEKKPLPLPITKRKPSEPLNEKQRAEFSAKNLEKLSVALKRFVADKHYIPCSNVRSSKGAFVMSWRVALLPYLGYQDLYERLNFEEPWDSPNNLRLLPYIPDEYVSPERFDWQTNWLGTAGPGYLMNEPDKTDPFADTVFAFEVNDAQAVPWTKPQDYGLSGENIREGIGSLRAQGVYTLWADGSLGVIPNAIPLQELQAACTCSGGEDFTAIKINRAIRFDDDLEAFEDNVRLANDPKTVGPTQVAAQAMAPATPQIPREPVPTPHELKKASDSLRKLFADKISAATTQTSKAALAKELVEAAQQLKDDPAGAYALLQAAANLATSSGDLSLLLDALDLRVGRFEVDSLRENHEALSTFATSHSNRSISSADGQIYLRRSIPVMFGLSMRDDYVAASEILKHAIQFTDLPKTDPILRESNILRAQLASCQRNYESVKDALATHRVEPDNPEASLQIGRFLCFIKGDWEQGLELISEYDQGELGKLAKLDLEGSDDAMTRLSIADSWWQMSELAKTSIYRQAALDRAVYWYKLALDQLPNSLDMMHAKARINDKATANRGNPLATLKYLAELVGTPLDQSLQAMTAGRPMNAAAPASSIDNE